MPLILKGRFTCSNLSTSLYLITKELYINDITTYNIIRSHFIMILLNTDTLTKKIGIKKLWMEWDGKGNGPIMKL
jgi:hypothetical protein